MELIVSISSVVIALAALFIAYWQGHFTRQHNRLSVTPRLQTHTDQDDSGNSGHIELILSNAGVGPGIIKTFELKKNGELVGELSKELVYTELKGLPLKTKNVRTSWIQPGYMMGEKEKFSLVRIEFEPSVPTIPASALLDGIREIFDSYEIVSDYESIYGDKFEFKNTKERAGGTGSVPS
ncbi:MAG: hypothetical protein GXY61_02860 [Lentisphaerae bacterium]|nr:hypothetical protein [Lentisphaerota bacterium]